MIRLAYKKGSDNFNASLSTIKNVLLPMFMLSLLEIRPMYVSEMVSILERESGGTFSTTYPYDVVFRLTEYEYMIPDKKMQVDGRRRQMYTISEEGRKYLKEIKKEYDEYINGIELVWNFIESVKSDNGMEDDNS